MTKAARDEALKALARRARRRKSSLKYYERNKERINKKRRARYRAEKELIRQLETEVKET